MCLANHVAVYRMPHILYDLQCSMKWTWKGAVTSYWSLHPSLQCYVAEKLNQIQSKSTASCNISYNKFCTVCHMHYIALAWNYTVRITYSKVKVRLVSSCFIHLGTQSSSWQCDQPWYSSFLETYSLVPRPQPRGEGLVTSADSSGFIKKLIACCIA